MGGCDAQASSQGENTVMEFAAQVLAVYAFSLMQYTNSIIVVKYIGKIFKLTSCGSWNECSLEVFSKLSMVVAIFC